MQILIICPFGKEKDIFNLLEPLHKMVVIESNEIYAKLFENISKNCNVDSSLIERKLAVGSMEQMVKMHNDLNEEENYKSIFIGPLSKECKVDMIISFIPDILEAEEDLIETKYNYKDKFYTSNDADYRISDERLLLSIIKDSLWPTSTSHLN